LSPQQVIHIQPLAPAKPAFGEACNGCGVCCLAETCPLGLLISRSRLGPCKALIWVAERKQYRCGVLGDGDNSKGLFFVAWARLRKWMFGRWIAAGKGCDCDLQVSQSSTISDLKPINSPLHHD
jgi:hypothetical protein